MKHYLLHVIRLCRFTGGNVILGRFDPGSDVLILEYRDQLRLTSLRVLSDPAS